MGKNMMATECEVAGCEELCYYGATVCNDCKITCKGCNKTIRKSSPFYEYVTSDFCKECQEKLEDSRLIWEVNE